MFYIDELTLLMSMSQKINECMISYLANRKVFKLKCLIMTHIVAYKSKEFRVFYLLFDNGSTVTSCIPVLNEK